MIAEAQDKAAKAFGARRTFFATNGTSTANKVIFQTLLAPGEKLLLDRNCHKRVHHGVVLSGAHPIYSTRRSTASTASTARCRKKRCCNAIEKHPDAQALITHLVHLRWAALRPAADHRGGARQRHQGDHRRGLVRLRALPPGLPPHRARGGRRLRDAEHA